MEYNSVNDKMPDFLEEEPHMKKILFITERYGEFLGWYDGKHFRTNYSSITENVTHWSEIPKRP